MTQVSGDGRIFEMATVRDADGFHDLRIKAASLPEAERQRLDRIVQQIWGRTALQSRLGDGFAGYLSPHTGKVRRG